MVSHLHHCDLGDFDFIEDNIHANFSVKHERNNMWQKSIHCFVKRRPHPRSRGSCGLQQHIYNVATHSLWDFHTVNQPILRCTECKRILLTFLNGIFSEINMIKLLIFTLLLCFLLSFKKILPPRTTALGTYGNNAAQIAATTQPRSSGTIAADWVTLWGY